MVKMSSVENFVEPELSNYYYKPITINKLNLTKEGSVLVNKFVFVGSVTNEIKTILNGLTKENYKKHQDTLEEYFGENFEEELLINEYLSDKKKSAMRGGAKSRNESYDVSSSESDNEIGNFNDSDNDNSSDSDSDDSINIGENNTENNIDVLFNEKPIILQEKNKKSQEKNKYNNSYIIYIYDSIIKFFTVSDLMLKIAEHLKIPVEYQNISYQQADGTSNNLLYQINYLSNSAEYYVNIANAYLFSGDNTISDIPIDSFYQKKYNTGQIIIHDFRKVLLIDYETLGREINVYSLSEFLQQSLPKGFYGVTEFQQKQIYESFVLKFFPQCNYNNFKESINKNKILRIDAKKLDFIGTMQRTIKNTFATRIKQISNYAPKKITIASCGIKTNLITKNLGEKVTTFDLRMVFRLFQTSKAIPFVVYYDLTINKKQIKYHIDTEKKFPYLIYNWKKAESKKNKIKNFIAFKVLKHTPESPNYNSDSLSSSDYLTIHLYSYGNTDTRVSWTYSDNTTFTIAKAQIFDSYRTFTNEINKIDPIAFIGYKLIPFPEIIEYFTIKFKFDLENTKIESFKHLEKFLLEKYSSFYKRSFENESSHEKMYLSYTRNSPNNVTATKDQPVNKLLAQSGTGGDMRTIFIEMDNNLYPRVVLQGLIKNHRYFVIVYNFIVRSIIDYVINVQSKNVQVAEKIYTDKRINNSKLRQLQMRDDVLFNFRTNIGENPYSRICQHNKQPNAYTLEEFKALVDETKDPAKKEEYTRILQKNESSINVLVYENKTYPGTNLYYTCSDKIYKYPGFQIGSNKHPTHYCLPCCKKLPSVTDTYKKLNNNMKQFLSCIGRTDLIKQGTSNDANSLEPIVVKTENYVKIYGKDIGYDRLGHLPITLAKLFEVKQNYSYITPSVNSMFIYGSLQGKWALMNAILTAFGVTVHNSGEIYFNAMIEKMNSMEYIDVYDKLSNGLLKQTFPNVEDYRKYIIETNYIDEYLFLDFIRTMAPVTYKPLNGHTFNIIIIADDSELHGKDLGSEVIIDFVDKDPMSILSEPETVMILRQNGVAYYPLAIHKSGVYHSIFNENTLYDPVGKIADLIYNSRTITKSYNHNDKKVLNRKTKRKDLIDSNELKTKESLTRVEDSANLFTIETIMTNSPNAEIVGQITNEKNFVYEVVIEYARKKFIVPLQVENLTRGVPIIKKGTYNYPDIATLYDFLLNSSFDFKLKRLVMNEHDEVTGIYNTHGLLFKVLPIAKKNYKEIPKELHALQVVHRSEFIQNDNALNSIIYENKKSTFAESKDLLDYKYIREIYELFKLEIASYLSNEINTPLREEINKILANKKTTLKDIIDINTLYPDISFNDREIIKKIFERPQNKRSLDINQMYSFDTVTKNKLIKLTSDIKVYKNEIIKIISNISESIIHINSLHDSKKKEFIETTVRSICNNYDHSKYKCENTAQCFWNSSNKCKLIMSANDYKYFLSMFIEDFINNDYIRDTIIYNTLSSIKTFKEKSTDVQKIESYNLEITDDPDEQDE